MKLNIQTVGFAADATRIPKARARLSVNGVYSIVGKD